MNSKKEHNDFSFKRRLKSFQFAFEGLVVFFKTQPNAWIHLLAAILVGAAGFYFQLDKLEWFMIITAIALVFIVEMINTAIEFLCDKIEPTFDPQIKRIKDISAAAVLFAAIIACVIGGIVFIPKFF
ncbi:MAG: diacylglycerol kinase family protein [Bacteroidetes bacterium]|nr:diacylglycerol kinase family protein [Bacteroidota bacterium]